MSDKKRGNSTGPVCSITSPRFDALLSLFTITMPIFLTRFTATGYYIYALKNYFVSISYRPSMDALITAE